MIKNTGVMPNRLCHFRIRALVGHSHFGVRSLKFGESNCLARGPELAPPRWDFAFSLRRCRLTRPGTRTPWSCAFPQDLPKPALKIHGLRADFVARSRRARRPIPKTKTLSVIIRHSRSHMSLRSGWFASSHPSGAVDAMVGAPY